MGDPTTDTKGGPGSTVPPFSQVKELLVTDSTIPYKGPLSVAVRIALSSRRFMTVLIIILIRLKRLALSDPVFALLFAAPVEQQPDLRITL